MWCSPTTWGMRSIRKGTTQFVPLWTGLLPRKASFRPEPIIVHDSRSVRQTARPLRATPLRWRVELGSTERAPNQSVGDRTEQRVVVPGMTADHSERSVHVDLQPLGHDPLCLLDCYPGVESALELD